MNSHERSLLIGALEANGWVQKDAASALGMTPKSFWKRLKKHGLTGIQSNPDLLLQDCFHYRVLAGLVRAFILSTVDSERDALAAGVFRELEFLEEIEASESASKA